MIDQLVLQKATLEVEDIKLKLCKIPGKEYEPKWFLAKMSHMRANSIQYQTQSDASYLLHLLQIL